MTGRATLHGGTLSGAQGFTAPRGEKFPIASSSALAGKFKPVHTATGVTLEVG